MRKLDVLVVEDDPDAQYVLRRHLQYEGARVVVAADGGEALRRLQTFTPDLALVDLRLPVVDGIELVTRMRADARWARVPVIAVTAHTDPSDVLGTVEADFQAHVGKPFDFEVLTALMQRLTAKPTRPRKRGAERQPITKRPRRLVPRRSSRAR